MPTNVPPYTKFTRVIGEAGLTADQNALSAQVEALTLFINGIQANLPAPEIFSLSPESGGPGTKVRVVGKNLQGITSVSMPSVAGDMLNLGSFVESLPFTILSSTVLEFTVTANTGSGQVTVASPTGQTTGPFFTIPNTPPVLGTLTVNPNPSVVGSVLLLSVDATDADELKNVDFFYKTANGADIFIGSTSTPLQGNTYQISWTPQVAGSFTVRSKATDGKGSFAFSPYSALIVNANPVTQTPGVPPSIAVDLTARTISASTSVQGDVIEQNINNGGWEVYAGPIPVGTVLRAAGYYRFRVQANASHGVSNVSSSQQIPAGDGRPPSTSNGPQNVTLLVPSGNLTAGTSYELVATANSALPLLSATLYEGAKLISVDTTAPYKFTYVPEETGPKVLKVVFVNNNSQTGEATQAVNVVAASGGGNLNNPPTVTLSTPTSQTVSVGTSLPWSITATDSDGTIVSREFLVAGVVSGTGTSGNYTFNTAGTFALAARATDNSNVSATSSPAVTITVTASTSFTTSLSGLNQIADGMSFVANSSEILEFNLINGTSGATFTLAITSLGATSYVDFASEYAGQPYQFTNSAGTKFSGVFPSAESSTVTY